MDLLYPVLRTVLICLVGFSIAYQGRRKGYTIFNLSGRFNRLQFIILFIALMILFYIVDIIEERFNRLHRNVACILGYTYFCRRITGHVISTSLWIIH